MQDQSLSGRLVDVHSRQIYPARLIIRDGLIHAIERLEEAPERYILPGFVDAHIHIESSMLTPYEFARKALIHGTVATVSDPHEIANVCGMEGVEYMITDSKSAKLKIHFGAPSCVPATRFESSGATLGIAEVTSLLQSDDIYYLSEMMNYPGVLYDDIEVAGKIAAAKKIGKPIDGHAPGLTGNDAIKYISAGISTDHECFTKAEALFKLQHGMKIIIREGSAARNFDALHELISEYPDKVMFCSDDKHPDELIRGHINQLVSRAIGKGHELFDVLQCACVNPVSHYQLRSGMLRTGDAADFIIVEDLALFNVLETWIDGECVAKNGHCILPAKKPAGINQFDASPKTPSDFMIEARSKKINVIEAVDGQLVTNCIVCPATIDDGLLVANQDQDILKIAVVNRYQHAPVAVGFIKNFGFKDGAIASTVAHDSHNIIVVGTADEYLASAVNAVITHKGGLSVVNALRTLSLPLNIAGLMSDMDCDATGKAYASLDQEVKRMGSALRAPYMTLSFMALLVIPSLKLSDKGLFDGAKFSFAPLQFD